MIELSSVGKIMAALKLATIAHVGVELTYFDVIELLGEIESLKGYIAELEAELKNARELIGMTPEPAFPAWIPVSERLPKKDGQYIGCTNTGLVSTHWLVDGHFIDTYSCEHNWLITPTSWILESASSGDVHVTHWMPLPEPPEVRNG